MTVKRAALRRTAAVGLAALVTFAGPAPAHAGDVGGYASSPPPPGVVVTVSSMTGSGCPPGSATMEPASDNTFLRLTFTAHRAQIGGAAKPTDFRKNCQVATLIRPPSGYTFAVTQVSHQGGIDLAPGATAVLNELLLGRSRATAAPDPVVHRPSPGHLGGR